MIIFVIIQLRSVIHMCRTSIYLLLIVQLFVFNSCHRQTPSISVECELNNLHNYHIKWDVYPHIHGEVEIYVSQSPYHFNTNTPPAKRVDIAEGTTHITTKNSTNRHYFLLKFNNTYSHIVASRSQKIGNVENFRDIGGYENREGRQVKWGMLFRSGDLDNINNFGVNRLKLLNIHTCYSFSDSTFPESLHFIDNHYIPLKQDYYKDIKSKVQNNELRRGDAIVFMQDLNINFVEDMKEELTYLLTQQLIDESNYPMVINSQYGKDHIGFVVALIHYLLDVPEKFILQDYLLSNYYLNKVSNKTTYLKTAPTNTQEAVTALLAAEKIYIGAAFYTIRKQYGSIDNYLTKEIGITNEMRERLKSILLY